MHYVLLCVHSAQVCPDEQPEDAGPDAEAVPRDAEHRRADGRAARTEPASSRS